MRAGKVQFNLELFAEFVVKGGDKLAATIRDKCCWQAVVHPNVAEEQLRHLWCLHALAWDHVSILGQSIDNAHDVFVAFRLGEIYNKVYRDVLLSALRDW